MKPKLLFPSGTSMVNQCQVYYYQPRSREIMHLIASVCMPQPSCLPTATNGNNQVRRSNCSVMRRGTDGRTDATKYVISLTLKSIMNGPLYLSTTKKGSNRFLSACIASETVFVGYIVRILCIRASVIVDVDL